MRRFIAYALCSAGMLGFYFLVRFAILGISRDFGNGFFAGVVFLVALFWIADRLGAVKIVEPDKGTWIPHNPDDS
jgi:hypothetical protein